MEAGFRSLPRGRRPERSGEHVASCPHEGKYFNSPRVEIGRQLAHPLLQSALSFRATASRSSARGSRRVERHVLAHAGKSLTDARLQPHHDPALSGRARRGAPRGFRPCRGPARGWPARSGPARRDHLLRYPDTVRRLPVALQRGDFVVELLDAGGIRTSTRPLSPRRREAYTERFVVGFLRPAATASLPPRSWPLVVCAA